MKYTDNFTKKDTMTAEERAWSERLEALAEEKLEFETLPLEEVAELKRQGRI